MANRHYPVEHEFEVELKVKVKVKSLSNYHPMSEERIKEVLKELETELKAEIYSKLVGEYSQEDDVTQMCDYVTYEVEKA